MKSTLFAALAFAALQAQDTPPPAEPPTEPGLSDLSDTVRQLEDAPPAEAPPEAAAPPAETPPPAEAAPPPAEPAPATPPPPAPPLTRAQMAEIDRLVARGQLLTTIARAGLLATRDMLSRVSDPAGAGIVGWLAEPAGNAMTVTFYADGEHGPVAVFRSEVLGGRVTERQIHLGADRPALNPIQTRMAAARAAVSPLDHAPCSTEPFNVFVIPPAGSDAPIDVYQVTAATQAGKFPYGGHFRSTVAPDGTVSGSRALTRACLDLDAPATPDGQQPRPVGVTHGVDPMPNELHILLSAWMGRPLLVATREPSRIWLVTPDRIAEVRD